VRYKELEAEREKVIGQVTEANLKSNENIRKEREEIAKLADDYANAIMEEGEAIDRANELLREQARLADKVAESISDAADAQDGVTEAVNRTVSAMAPLRGGDQFNDASDEALRSVASRNRQRARDITNPAIVGSFTQATLNKGEAARLNFEAQNAENIVASRQQLRRSVGAFGVEGARSQYQGDPLMFDQLVQRFVQDTRTNQEIAREQNQFLRDLNDRLGKRGFTK
jgi:hypothetical protein